MDRPKSTHSTLSHVTENTERTSTSQITARATPATPSHKTWTAYTGPVLFTGPSGLRNQRVKTESEFVLVGESDNSTEITSQMGYLNRAAPGAEFPKAKNGQVGEIGWVYDKLKIVKGI
ncbi:uncharacterized protein LOC132746427 isoform X2 [Ruditapes philippinarum]|nr:uncharacterized protein LOC132746427 isoform X2 [Ruditapes philippinarum]